MIWTGKRAYRDEKLVMSESGENKVVGVWEREREREKKVKGSLGFMNESF